MAPKKPNPMEEPPAASSSEEAEETSDEEATSSEEEEEEDTQEQGKSSPPPPLQQQTQKQTTPKKPDITSAPTPQSKSSSSEESGSESESESEPDSTPKPIATKPMEETPKPAKSRTKPSSKRPGETEDAQKDSKRAKKKGTEPDPDDEDQKKPGEDTKKQLFQRLWSEDDEIAVLKGMIEFSTKKGVDPNQDMNAFHDFIKKSLHVDVTRTQLMDKIRRLKKKYENNLGRGKKGEDRTFSKPHEQKAYDLSKKLWGSESASGVLDSTAKSNGKARKNQTQRGNSKPLASLRAELFDGAKDGEKMEIDDDKEGIVNAKEKVSFDKSLGVAGLDNSLGVAGLEEFVVKNGLDMIGGSKRAELEERWKKLHIAQLQLFVERNDLIKEQAKLMLEAMKSSGN